MATKNGDFDAEIVPVAVPNPKRGEKDLMIAVDAEPFNLKASETLTLIRVRVRASTSRRLRP